MYDNTMGFKLTDFQKVIKYLAKVRLIDYNNQSTRKL